MNEVVGSRDILLITLDTLRWDIARRCAREGRTPRLTARMPGGRWARRHAPGSFTYASHQAMFAGFLPTPEAPGPHPRLFAARFPGSGTTAPGTFVYDAPDLVTGLAARGYRTVCVGGVGFFTGRGPLGSVLPGLFGESRWEPSFGVASPDSTRAQVDHALDVLDDTPADRRLFLFLNVSALHQPNWFHLPGGTPGDGDGPESHAAALAYADGHLGRLLDGFVRRGRPCFAIVCSDHGTAYGEDGHVGHRIGHPVVWTVPYTHFFLDPPEEP
ncbi:STM4013/SEN3800 family hydrolase [Streptomyces sp. ST2-7A]|uniref:STM4013/SEN3800 family hydrolase n=1 Tax=Streptomyces sp. ST2-7A TaxID=2907214 RepID=UPI001F15AAFD|nr:STM4013/SEN3800 family hydrolase [Streptomyces sp. ST2-7A]MCE7079291.1 STM4013/SEN3800 family hydrolase [Streptomyces sp. ST2-7A]